MKLLRIILPNFNYRDGLNRNLNSICEQVGADGHQFEVVISDDTIDDSLKELFDERTEVHSFCRYVRGPQRGAVENWNRCLEDLDADYSLFLHHDETLASPLFLSALISLLETDKYDVVILPLRKQKDGKVYKHYPRFLQYLFVAFPALLFTCNAFGSPSVFVFRSSMAKAYDAKLRWLVDVEWYYQFLVERPRVKLVSCKDLIILSDLDFAETETNDMAVDDLLPREAKHIGSKHDLCSCHFKSWLAFLKVPIKIYAMLR